MELFTPDFGLIFWMFVVLVILIFLLGKFAWPAIVKALDARADFIDKGVVYAREAKEQLDNSQVEATKFIQEAQKQQAEILREAAKMKTKIIEEAKEAASKEAKKVMDAAQISIEQSRKESKLRFREEVSSFSLEIAEKVMRGNLKNEKAQSELVNKLIDEFEAKN